MGAFQLVLTKTNRIGDPKYNNADEPAGWAWEMNGWSWRLHENYPSVLRNIENIPHIRKEIGGRSQPVNRLDLETLGFWPIFAQKSPGTLCPTSWGGPELMISKVIGVALFTDFARLRWDPHFQPSCREAFSLVRFTPLSDSPQAPATHHTHSPALAARWRIGRTSRRSFWCNIAGTRYVYLGPRV